MEMKETRRQVVKKALYVAPAVLTMKVAPAFAATGSGPLPPPPTKLPLPPKLPPKLPPPPKPKI